MKNYGLLGRKLSHSYSPAIHEAFGGYNYALFEVEPSELADFMARKDLHGLNVTIPYKQAVMEFCCELSPVAAEIGSVNTLVRMPGGKFYGDNTDVAGFGQMVSQSGIDARGKKVIIIGNGGSSLSCQYVMKDLAAGEIVIVSRANNNHEFLSMHKDARIFINTTPVGMYPDTGYQPVSLDYFPELEGVLDLIYNPARTRLMMDAEHRGIPCLGGLSMLVGQAAASSKIFTGQKIDGEKEFAVVEMLRRNMENIILIGMPGCGKSTLGKLLAENTNRVFIDTDTEIENEAKCTIPEIFSLEGETGFRAREAAIIEKYGKQSGLVIATGGGCVTYEDNYYNLRQNGSLVFVERNLDKLDRDGRPLSQGDVCALYEKRLPLYRRFADCSVRNDEEISSVVSSIMKVL